jgi:hypothetical protein
MPAPQVEVLQGEPEQPSREVARIGETIQQEVRWSVAFLGALVAGGASARRIVGTQDNSNRNPAVCRWPLCGQEPLGR